MFFKVKTTIKQSAIPKNFQKQPKCSIHGEGKNTRVFLSKQSEENIQEQLKSCTTKDRICKKVSVVLKDSGYDNDDDIRKVRINTLVPAQWNFNDTKPRSTGTVPPMKPPCYENINAVLEEKPTTLLLHLI